MNKTRRIHVVVTAVTLRASNPVGSDEVTRLVWAEGRPDTSE